MRRSLCRSVVGIFSVLLCFTVVPVSHGAPLDLLPFENLTADIGRGFGDSMNRYSWSMDNFNGNVYVGTWNVVLDYPAILNAIKNGEIGGGGNPLEGIKYTHSHGGEIWKHNGGQNWERVFKAGEDDNGFRVMAQTSLGEILKPKKGPWNAADADLAYRAINSKRADFVVVDRRGIAVLAVEYQGHGHYQGNALMRDAVKREVFRKANVTLLAVPAEFANEDVAAQVRDVLEGHLERNSANVVGLKSTTPRPARFQKRPPG